jgi:hypothetical protein
MNAESCSSVRSGTARRTAITISRRRSHGRPAVITGTSPILRRYKVAGWSAKAERTSSLVKIDPVHHLTSGEVVGITGFAYGRVMAVAKFHHNAVDDVIWRTGVVTLTINLYA